MIVKSLKELEQRVDKDSEKNKIAIRNFRKDLEKSNLIKGRVRPRNPIKQKILVSFKRKDNI